MNPEPVNDSSEPIQPREYTQRHPHMDPLTQRFADELAESRYQLLSAHEALPVTRIGLKLGILLYAGFGLVDMQVVPDQLAALWTIRLTVSAVLLFAYLFFRHSRLIKYHQAVMAAVAMIAGAGILGMIMVIPHEAGNRYYVGLILVIMGTYSVFGLRFFAALMISVLLAGTYIALVGIIRPIPTSALLNNVAFLVSAVVIGAVGMRGIERHARISFARQELLDQERRESLHKAMHDPLCDIANRRMLILRIEQALPRTTRFGGLVAVVFMDLDDFKPLNDQFGHRFGDEVLQALSRRLQAWTRKTDTLARIGGDEFVILLEDIRSRGEVKMLVDRLMELFSTPLEVAGRSVSVSASIGVAMHPGDASEPHDLLDRADQAMYHAKTSTDVRCAYYDELDEEEAPFHGHRRR